jgi:hypothetical protein
MAGYESLNTKCNAGKTWRSLKQRKHHEFRSSWKRPTFRCREMVKGQRVWNSIEDGIRHNPELHSIPGESCSYSVRMADCELGNSPVAACQTICSWRSDFDFKFSIGNWLFCICFWAASNSLANSFYFGISHLFDGGVTISVFIFNLNSVCLVWGEEIVGEFHFRNWNLSGNWNCRVILAFRVRVVIRGLWE